MTKTTIAAVDKKVAVMEQRLLDHVTSCEKLSEQTLSRIKRIELIHMGSTVSLIAIIGLMLRLVFFS